MITKEQWFLHRKEMDRRSSELLDEILRNWYEQEQRKKVEEEARKIAEESAKQYIDSQKRNIEIEVDRRSVDKALKEMFKRF